MKFAAFFVKNYQFTLIIFIMVLLLGINSLMNMPRGEDPPFNPPTFSVVAVYPGTSPQDMEELIVEPIEEKLYELDDIKRIRTNIYDGVQITFVEFKYGVDTENKKNILNREVNALRAKLPADLISLDVNALQSSDVSILQCAFISESLPYRELEKKAKDLKKKLEKITSLKKITIAASPEQEVKITINLEKMAQNRIGLNRVLGALQANNVNIPGGNMELGEKTFNIKTTADFEKLEDIKRTIINASPAGVVYLQDVADVNMGYEQQNHLARLNGKRAIWVSATLKDKQNILKTKSKIDNILTDFEKEIPKEIVFKKVFDQAENVSHRLGGFARDFSIAILLVLITLLPLGWRASLVVMISIPLSLAIGLALLDYLGYTINQLSIVGMVVALGLLVDDSIIVVENIERYLRMGYNKIDASIEATNQIVVAVLGCTATLVFAFLPLTFLPEGAGDFVRSLPMAVLCTVLASLFVALTIIPFLSSQILSSHEKEEGNFFMRMFKRFINQPYRIILEWGFKNPFLTLISAFLIFVGSLALVPMIGVSVFPKSEKPMFIVNIGTPLGTNIEATNKVARHVENIILKEKEIKTVSTNVGKGNPRVFYNVRPTDNAPNTAQLFCQTEEMTMKAMENFLDRLRQKIGIYAGARIEVYQFEQGPPIDAPLAIRILGENLDTLRKLSFEIEDILKNTEGTQYIKNPLKTLKNDLQVKINKEKAGRLGVPIAEIAKTVRLSIAGLNLGQLRNEEGEEFKINVSIEHPSPEKALEIFGKTYITAITGALIPLSQLADIQLVNSPSVINHYNKDRFILITSFVKTGFNTSQLTQKIDAQLSNFKFPKSYSYMLAGEAESSSESFGGIGTIAIVAFFGLFAILVLEFRTFKSTLIVLSVVPLGIIGALITLFLVGKTLSFVAVIGIIALMGIEIKNSILLVDYTNQLREQGKSLDEAIRDGAETRFLPILLTSMTAIGGLIPLVIEDAPLYSPLAWVLIGGLISSTLLSRIVTPVLYKLLPPKVKRITEK
ncbi:MAG: efflux RND transporter permease subunit [Cytophagales bacterium]|nr:MAG: efflux RND transporter permease subunit [Cytophagales bacterium]